MPEMLTPPVWCDKKGNLIDMLNGNTASSTSIALGSNATAAGINAIAIGQKSALFDIQDDFARYPGTYASDTSVAIGWGAKAIAANSVAIGPGFTGTAIEKPTCTMKANSVAIGSAASASREGGIAIGFNSEAESGVSIGGSSSEFDFGAISNGNGIAIGSQVAANSGGVAIGYLISSSGGGIAIGGSATANKVQLGSNSTKYDLTVGNGTGILGIGSIKFEKMAVSQNAVDINSPGVYLCCATKSSISGVVICFVGNTSGSATVLESSTDLCKYVGTDMVYGNVVQQIQAKSGVTINYCFKIVSLT